ncbi:MAG: hypothetical protein RJA70_2700 [Pseudomonadota bacterium]|jgi:PAS domain S-box-containing protein
MGGTLDQWISRLSDPMLRAFTENSSDVVMVLAPDASVRFINWVAPGLTVDQVIGVPVYNFVSEDQREVMRACFEQVRDTRMPGRYPSTFAPADGRSMSFWESRVAPVVEDSEFVGFLVMSSDITERREAAHQRDKIFTLSVDLLCMANFDGYFVRVNPAFSTLLGYSEEQLLSTPFSDYVHPDDREPTRTAMSKLTDGQPVRDFENRYRTASGKYVAISWTASSQLREGLVFAVGRDVTEKRALELQLRQSQKLDAVGQLAGGLAHDFNNLLLSIMVNIEFATTLAGDLPELREHLEEVQQASQRAADLVKQMLAFSRREPVRSVSFDVNDLVRGLLKMMRRLIAEDVEIDFVPAHGALVVRGDPTQIEQVLMNLCLNARDAMPSGGRLTLETENVVINGRFRETHPWARPGRYVLINVSDTGEGMTTEVSEHIFEPFFTTKPPGKGTGLGLATAYAIVAQHSGLLHVYSEVGTGTTLKVYLPAGETLAAEVGSRLDPGLPGGTATILVAEDDDMVRAAVCQILTRAGYKVHAVASGAKALEALGLLGAEVAVVLLDVVMPEMSGPDAYARIRAEWPHVKVLFSSGYTDRSRFAGILPQDVPLLEKPYRAESLLNQIHRLLRGGEPAPA